MEPLSPVNQLASEFSLTTYSFIFMITISLLYIIWLRLNKLFYSIHLQCCRLQVQEAWKLRRAMQSCKLSQLIASRLSLQNQEVWKLWVMSSCHSWPQGCHCKFRECGSCVEQWAADHYTIIAGSASVETASGNEQLQAVTAVPARLSLCHCRFREWGSCIGHE